MKKKRKNKKKTIFIAWRFLFKSSFHLEESKKIEKKEFKMRDGSK